MIKVCICIPTYNRLECMKYLLQAYSSYFEQYDYFDVWISDTSSDDEIDLMLQSYANQFSKRIFYQHIPEYPDKTTDLKVANSFEHIKDRYDYVYLCGDGILINIEDFYNTIRAYGDSHNKFDLIHFNKYVDQPITYYTSGKQFLKDCGWLSTYYGATVLSTGLIKRIDYLGYVETFRNTGFMYWEGLISGIASEHERIIVLKDSLTTANPYKGTNSSYQPKKFINFWVVNWNHVIDCLPSYYDDIKEYVKMDVGKKLGLYRIHNLLTLRNTHNLDYSDVRGKKKLFQAVSSTPFWFIVFVSRLPLALSKTAEKVIVALKKIMWR